MNRVLMLLPPLLFLALAAMFYWGMQRSNPGQLPSAFIGQKAPDLGGETLPGIAGFDQADLASGRVVLVNFWASWCPPCRAEHPTLTALSKQGIPVFGVNMMDKTDQALAFLQADGNPYTGVIFDPKGKMRLDWGVSAPPETFILRGDGTVAYRFVGPMLGSDYEQRFLPELEKAMAAE